MTTHVYNWPRFCRALNLPLVGLWVLPMSALGQDLRRIEALEAPSFAFVSLIRKDAIAPIQRSRRQPDVYLSRL
jgi:hypothetical protein